MVSVDSLCNVRGSLLMSMITSTQGAVSKSGNGGLDGLAFEPQVPCLRASKYLAINMWCGGKGNILL